MRLLLIFLWISLGSSLARADNVLVFAAASLKNALDEIGTEFERTQPHTVQFNFAGSSQIARQVVAGAPADLLITANVLWMDEVASHQAIMTDSRFHLASNRLVIASVAREQIALTQESLQSTLGSGHIAMALIDAVPAGMYGKAALEALDLWTDVQGQVVQTDHVRSALRLVALGEVRWGIVYRSDVLADPTVFLAAEFPADTHPPIVYPVALTVRNEPSKGATAFHAYLKSERARQILTKHGFQPPVENRS